MSKVTLVTGLWDLGRENLTGFKRSFDHYVNRFDELLSLDFNFVIFVPPELEKHVYINRGHSKRTSVVVKSLEELRQWFPFYKQVQNIRTSPEWLEGQPSWLPESPQAALADYNPVIMSKMFMLNDASIIDNRQSDYYFWIDAGLTSTVSTSFLKQIANIPAYMADKRDKFLFITYPYEGGEEIHGFNRTALHKYCQRTVTEIPRGGFFGGHRSTLGQINGWYYDWLNATLHDGNMGTEESIFCILDALYSPKIHKYQVEGNGLVYPFFEQLQNYTEDKVPAVLPINKSYEELKTAVYILTYNSPKQVKWLLNSFEVADNDFLTKPDIFLIDNSTDPRVSSDYIKLCREYNMTHIKRDNIGICGARQLAAELFDQSDYDYYLFFEDDMFLFPPAKAFCPAGYSVYTPQLFARSLEIMHQEKYDYLKLSYSEFYGTNKTQWAWYNISQMWREHYFPEKSKLPESGLDSNPPLTNVKEHKTYGDLSYLEGDFFYCNWPLWMSKEGNRKIFIDSQSALFEQVWMAETFYKQQRGQIRCAVLKLSPINHNRFDFYPKEQRKEC